MTSVVILNNALAIKLNGTPNELKFCEIRVALEMLLRFENKMFVFVVIVTIEY